MKVNIIIFFTGIIFGYQLNKYIFYFNKKKYLISPIKFINKKINISVQTDIDNTKMNEILVHEQELQEDINDINKGIYKWTII